MRLERWMHEWDVFALIMAVGLLTGLLTFMAFDVHPGTCRHVVTHALGKMHAPAKAHLTWVCDRP